MSLQVNCVCCDHHPGEITLQSSVLCSKMFQEVTGLKIKQHYTICKACQLELRSCYNFRTRCHEIFTLYNSAVNLDNPDPLSANKDVVVLKKEPVDLLEEIERGSDDDNEFYDHSNNYEDEMDESQSRKAKKRRHEEVEHISFKHSKFMRHNVEQMVQNEVVLAQLNATINMLEDRIRTLEEHSGQLPVEEEFLLATISDLDEFHHFLALIEENRDYRRKCVKFLHKSCPAGQARNEYNGIVKNILDVLFCPEFKIICSWSTEKKPRDGQSAPGPSRIHLSEYVAFQNFLLDVLNCGSREARFTHYHVTKGIKEVFKRMKRNGTDTTVVND